MVAKIGSSLQIEEEHSMEIHIFENKPNDFALYFASPHRLHMPGANDRHLVTLTGACKYPFEGSNSEEWSDSTLHLHLIFPDIIPEKKWFKLENWAPFVTISGIDKGGDNHNGGWAVYDFGLDPGYTTIKPFKMPQGRIGLVSIWATVRVRGGLFDLFRIGYTLTVTGVLVDAQVEPIG
jgi:hypothetical protein